MSSAFTPPPSQGSTPAPPPTIDAAPTAPTKAPTQPSAPSAPSTNLAVPSSDSSVPPPLDASTTASNVEAAEYRDPITSVSPDDDALMTGNTAREDEISSDSGESVENAEGNPDPMDDELDEMDDTDEEEDEGSEYGDEGMKVDGIEGEGGDLVATAQEEEGMFADDAPAGSRAGGEAGSRMASMARGAGVGAGRGAAGASGRNKVRIPSVHPLLFNHSHAAILLRPPERSAVPIKPAHAMIMLT